MHRSSLRWLIALLVITMTLTVTACTSGPRVRTDYDKTVDFTQFKTFGFANPLGTDRSGYQTIVSQHLKTAARRELEARGLHYNEKSPQLLVNFNGKLSDKLRVDSTPTSPTTRIGVTRGYYGYRAGFYSAWPLYEEEARVTSYTEGTLNIDVVDATHKQMVWEGVAVGSVSAQAQTNLQPAIESAVTAIFKKFPIAVPADTAK